MSRGFRPLVLCYHAVSDGWEHALSTGPADFERQLRSLIARRWRPAPARELLDGSGRLLHVTFDDGYRSVEAALPALDRLGVSSTVFACSHFADVGAPLAIPELAAEPPAELATMDWDALRSLVERGVEVGSHTVSHPHLPLLGDVELSRELRESKERIEDELRRRCPLLAYPFGEEDARVQQAARTAGYEAAFALPGRLSPPKRFALPRVGVYRGDRVARMTLKTLARPGSR